MIGASPDCPPGIVLLADHLDATLTVGEDLLAQALPPRADLEEADPASAPEAFEAFIGRMVRLESGLVLRVLQARRHAAELGRADPSMKAAANLFRAQTGLMAELAVERGALGGGLERPGDAHAWLRSRGLIAPEAAAPSPFEAVAASDDLKVAGLIRLGDLLDAVAALLDLIDARFGLYPSEMELEPEAAAAEAAASPEVVQMGEGEAAAEVVSSADGAALGAAEPVASAAEAGSALRADAPAATSLVRRLDAAEADSAERPTGG